MKFSYTVTVDLSVLNLISSATYRVSKISAPCQHLSLLQVIKILWWPTCSTWTRWIS